MRAHARSHQHTHGCMCQAQENSAPMQHSTCRAPLSGWQTGGEHEAGEAGYTAAPLHDARISRRGRTQPDQAPVSGPRGTTRMCRPPLADSVIVLPSCSGSCDVQSFVITHASYRALTHLALQHRHQAPLPAPATSAHAQARERSACSNERPQTRTSASGLPAEGAATPGAAGRRA